LVAPPVAGAPPVELPPSGISMFVEPPFDQSPPTTPLQPAASAHVNIAMKFRIQILP
jgi:hypothetical protein